MNNVTNENFIVIDGQVAMPEETAAELLNVNIEKLREASRKVGIKNSPGGIYVRDGKYYYTSHEIIFKVRNANGVKSADLSTSKLVKLFQSAEERLLSEEEFKAKRRKDKIKAVIILSAIVGVVFFLFSGSESEKVSTPSNVPKVEQPVQQAAPTKVSNLGMTVEQFKSAFSSTALLCGVPHLNLDGAVYQQGSVQDALRYDFTPNVSLLGIVNKSNGMIRSVDILFTPKTNDDTTTAFMAYAIFMMILNPELNQDERSALFNELKLSSEGMLELKTISPKAIRGNNEYYVFYIEEYGILSLGVKARDDV